MAPTAADVRRWLEGFEAAELADQQARRRRGPQPERSIALALSLLEAAREAAGGQYPVDPRRSAEDEAVRVIWDRIRSPISR